MSEGFTTKADLSRARLAGVTVGYNVSSPNEVAASWLVTGFPSPVELDAWATVAEMEARQDVKEDGDVVYAIVTFDDARDLRVRKVTPVGSSNTLGKGFKDWRRRVEYTFTEDPAAVVAPTEPVLMPEVPEDWEAPSDAADAAEAEVATARPKARARRARK